jgi:hypothetical protein
MTILGKANIKFCWKERHCPKASLTKENLQKVKGSVVE